jgi:dTDP-glucose pyrophosphorylase
MREIIEVIDASALQIALVVDDMMKLLGTITDGDVRRAILRGVSLDDSACLIMNSRPIVASANESKESILAVMRSKSIHQLPIISDDGVLVGLEILNDLLQPENRTNVVVLMAGGVGSRLRPLTIDCPKPLLKVGNKPILETIIENFIEHGFRKFYLSVNYKAEMIEKYFGNGNRWGIDISYLREDEQMGTAGGLSLMPSNINEPFLVMNGDLLTKINFNQLLNFHLEHQAKATVCVRDYEIQVPYGVIRVDKHRMLSIEEKPVHQFFVNAGIYVLDPAVLTMIPPNTYFDMPTLLEKLIADGNETAVFPIREYWLDIGRIEDFQRAQLEVNEYATI